MGRMGEFEGGGGVVVNREEKGTRFHSSSTNLVLVQPISVPPGSSAWLGSFLTNHCTQTSFRIEINIPVVPMGTKH